ncbi:MAG TPA: PilZ domain-containing protein [Candidatus Omnitrophota bacterium]|nr:PilZ domain-containing protein [Candidatus Omnitrophota bacterium]
MRQHDRRQEARAAFNLPARISVGSQLSLQGRLKDLSFKSAFIEMKNSVYLDMNDEVGFCIERLGNGSRMIQGQARVSRVVAGEGLAIYFTRMDESSTHHLRELLHA